MDRHVREDEMIAEAIKATRRGVRDVQRPTGTEKARTTERVEEVAVESAFAKDLAEQLETELGPIPGQVQEALDTANDALVTASGKSTVVRSPNPATASGSYSLGDQWWQFSGADIVGLWLHDGAAWVAQEMSAAVIASLDAGKITTGVLDADRIGALSISAAKIAVGAIVAEKIAAEAITTAKLAADAIDGMTITGALIRTAPSGQRFEINVGGITGYTTTGSIAARISPAGGGIDVGNTLSGDSARRSNLGASNLTISKKEPGVTGTLLDYGALVFPDTGEGPGDYLGTSASYSRGGLATERTFTRGGNTAFSEAYMNARSADGPLLHMSTTPSWKNSAWVSDTSWCRLSVGTSGSLLQVDYIGYAGGGFGNGLGFLGPVVFTDTVTFDDDQPGIVRSYEGTAAFTPSAAFSVNYVQGEQVGGSISLSMRVTRIAGAPLNTGTVIGVLKPALLPAVTALLAGTTFVQSSGSVGLNLNVATDGTCTLNGGSIPGASTIVFGGTYKRSV